LADMNSNAKGRERALVAILKKDSMIRKRKFEGTKDNKYPYSGSQLGGSNKSRSKERNERGIIRLKGNSR